MEDTAGFEQTSHEGRLVRIDGGGGGEGNIAGNMADSMLPPCGGSWTGSTVTTTVVACSPEEKRRTKRGRLCRKLVGFVLAHC
jgi:hypothetical protein